MGISIELYMDVDTGAKKPYRVGLFDNNITHNLVPMWTKAGVYDALYNSDDKLAGDIIETLNNGINDMMTKEEEYKLLNPKNGWGNYQNALDFLLDLEVACKEHPKASIWISK